MSVQHTRLLLLSYMHHHFYLLQRMFEADAPLIFYDNSGGSAIGVAFWKKSFDEKPFTAVSGERNKLGLCIILYKFMVRLDRKVHQLRRRVATSGRWRWFWLAHLHR